MKRIAAEYIYPLGGQKPLRNGFVEFDEAGYILGFGKTENPGTEAVFYKGAIVPGFVNSHCHIELSYMWKLFRKGTGMAGFIDQINAFRDTSPKSVKVAEKIGRAHV